jgi:hypothetical protein
MTRQEFLAWEQAAYDCIDVKRSYIRLAGDDLVAGVLLSQILYWHLPTTNGSDKLRVEHDGELWLAKGRAEWWDECCITPKQFDRASEQLEARGLIAMTVKRFNGNPTKHIRICWDNFLRDLALVVMTVRGGKTEREPSQKTTNPVIPKRGTTDFGHEGNGYSPFGNNGVPKRLTSLTENKNKEKNSKTNQQTNLLSQIPTRTCARTHEGARVEAEAAPVAEAGLVGWLVSDESSFFKANEPAAQQKAQEQDPPQEKAPMGDIVAGLVATGMPLAEAEGRLAQHGDASCQLLLERRQRLQKRWKNSKGAEAAKTPTAAPTASNSALVASAPEPQPPPVPEPVPEMDVTQELQSFGISPARVAQLIETHGEARCRQAVLQVPEYANAVRQGRWIVKALAEGWTFGKPAREWKLNDAKDLPLLVEAHGLNAVCAEMLRRADQLERKGDLPTARRRRRIVALLRQGLPGDQAIAQAREEQLALPR